MLLLFISKRVLTPIKYGDELSEEIALIIIALVSVEYERCLMLYERNIYEQ